MDEYLHFLVVVSQIEPHGSEKSFAELQFYKMSNDDQVSMEPLKRKLEKIFPRPNRKNVREELAKISARTTVDHEGSILMPYLDRTRREVMVDIFQQMSQNGPVEIDSPLFKYKYHQKLTQLDL